MKKIFVAFVCVACGGAATPASVTVASATPAATTTSTTPAPPPPKHALTLRLAWEAKQPPDVSDMAFDGKRLFFATKSGIKVVDEHGTVAAGATSNRRIVLAEELVDPSSFARHPPPALPKGNECHGIAFSADLSRYSAYCQDSVKGEDAVYVYDTRNGTQQVGRFDEWHSAAPIRSGAITPSGNFIFWSARAGGSFQEIKSRVIGPMMSSMSAMSPDETMLFTTPNKQWYTEDTTPAKILDPKNGRVLYELDNDITSVVFAPKGGLFAAHHSSHWRDMNYDKPDVESITVHASATDFAKLDAASAIFGDDGATLAAVSNGTVRVYAIER
jgi:hypothetical protein